MRFFLNSLYFIIFDFSINSSFWLIIYPFTYKELVFIMIVIRALTLSQIINPVAFKMVSISFSHYPISISASLMPLAFINISIFIYHSSFTLHLIVNPISIISVSIFKEKSSSSMFFIFKPIPSVFSPKLSSLNSPVSSLPMSFI